MFNIYLFLVLMNLINYISRLNYFWKPRHNDKYHVLHFLTSVSMAPNTSPLNSRSTLNEIKYHRRNFKSQTNNCNENNVQAKNTSKSQLHQVGDIRKNKKTLTKAKKKSKFSLFKPFGCGQCRMRFIQMDQLQKHVRYHNQEKNLLSSEKCTSDSSHGKTNRSISCCFPGCDKMFKTRKALGNHIRKDHPLV